MAHRTVHRLACLVTLLAVTASKEQTRWSRQISSYTADISDWVPLTGPVEREPAKPHHAPPKSHPLPPIKRQAVAEPRILSEPFPGFTRPTGFSQDSFPGRNFYNAPANRQLYLQSVPSAPQNYLTDQGFGQSIRFGLQQPNFPLSQGFISPQYSFDNVPAIPAIKSRPAQPALPHNPIKFESFQKQNLPSPHTKPYSSQQILTRPEIPKFVDGYRAENITHDLTYSPKKKVQSLQKIKYENYEKGPKIEPIPPKQKVEREEVQLLYVPVESLNRGQFNFRTQQLNHPELYSQSLPKPNSLKQAFSSEYQKPAAKPIDTFSTNQDYFSNYEVVKDDQIPKFSTISSPFPSAAPTTPKPKKLKPHQPPLAIFMTQEAKRGNQLKVGDVLSSLKSANTVAVLDTVNPLNAPNVFIGPSSLKPPENFVKFELPYLSNIENSDKKLRQLPFFVAPLSYNTPNGFAKIPFPSPHVGSVVINAQIRDTSTHSHPSHSSYSTPAANVIPNSYSVIPQDIKTVTQKPSFSYYSTSSPKTNAPIHKQQHLNYYSIEPQMVTSVPHAKEPETNYNVAPQKSGMYFLTNDEGQYNPTQYVSYPSQVKQEPINQHKYVKQESTTTPRTTVTTTTTRLPSTYPSQLLETHNPYSINQAFHFSTPLDYHSLYDDFKEPQVTPGATNGQKIPPSPAPPSSSLATKVKEVVTEKQINEQSPPSTHEQQPAVYQQQAPLYQQQQQPVLPQQSSPNYLQNYTPEIHYESEVTNSRYPVYNTNDYTTKPDVSSENYQSVKEINAEPVTHVLQPDYNQQEKQQVNSHEHIEYNPSSYENLTETIINKITGPADVDSSKQIYNNYEGNFETEDSHDTSSATSTTTTTTKRTPIRHRGRPRYTTAKPDISDSTTRNTVTRRPLRERRPLPTRPKYEPNKITTERATSKPLESGENTTKSTRTRTRGRVQYKPSENDDSFNKRNKVYGSKEADLAYQRDVLHQNYPVTLMERMSTVDIEAITEPSTKISSTKNLESGLESYDTENAYAHDSASISYIENPSSKEDTVAQTSGTVPQTEEAYVPKYSSTRGEEYFYQTRSSAAPIQSISSYEDTYKKQDEKPKETTPEIISYATEGTSSTAEQSQPNYSTNTDFDTTKHEADSPTSQGVEITKVGSQETNHETETEENIVQTTPSYNRVRVRPGVIRQYHQASSTDSSRPKIERKRPVQAVTYRPAFDRRRTTMRIEEIEADLKTKQIHSRPDVQDYKHPVYRPEPTTEPAFTTASSIDSTTKRGHFRRRRPVYTSTSTEQSVTKKSAYEIKSRFRGRRPTDKTTDKTDTHTETPTSTVKTTFNRYSHRPRLSERYNKKPNSEAEESEDQESNYSINRPKYAAPELEQWSPKISVDSFKPYNPNDIVEDVKQATTEQKSDIDEATLDIITARNDYEDILISVTPATNNRANKKIPDIPPTLEALVEQSKTIKNDSNDSMSTFETMLEEVMKSLEEQDEDEYTTNVMKHKGGEIGEIPPERIISSGDEFSQKSTAADDHDSTTPISVEEDTLILDKDQADLKGRRRGYWKKVKVRPISTETIETAESQYYTNTVNRLGEPVAMSKVVLDKSNNNGKPKLSVTTYKPTFQLIKELFEVDDDTPEEAIPTVDIPKIGKVTEIKQVHETEIIREDQIDDTTTVKSTSPGEEDLGTGSPDPTIMDSMYFSTPTEPTSSDNVASILDRSDGFSFMDYLFGVSTDNDKSVASRNKTKATPSEIEITTEQTKSKIATTESTYIPEEITAAVPSEDNTEIITEIAEIRKLITEKQETTEAPDVKIETSSVSSFMNPDNVVSTSMSTEISHETEICFRGKCIKTNKDLL